ncbi:MAG: hypothetical protein Q9213_004879 [Squamulea squamosa]
MGANVDFVYYRVHGSRNTPTVKSNDRTMTSIVESINRMDSASTGISVLVGHNECVIPRSSDPIAADASEPLDSVKGVEKVATVLMKCELVFLQFAALPESQNARDAMLVFFKILLSPQYLLNSLQLVKAKSLPILEIRFGYTNVTEQSLEAVMEPFWMADSENMKGLEYCVKGLRVQMSNNFGEDFKGNESKKYGGGSKDVEFYYRTKGKYIRQTIEKPHLPLVNVGTRSRPTYVPPNYCVLREGPSQEACVFSADDSLHIVNKGITNQAKMPQWPSNGINRHENRYPGLKHRLATPTLVTPCRMTTAPRIVYCGGKELTPSSGAWGMEQTGLSPRTTPRPIRCNVAVLIVGRSRWAAVEHISRTLETLRGWLRSFGMALPNTELLLETSMEVGKSGLKVKEDIRSKISDLIKTEAKALIVMLPCRSKPIYEYIKTLSGITLVLADNDQGYCFQTALKLNMKTSGQSQVLASSPVKAIKLGDTMIVGIDVLMPAKPAEDGMKPELLLVSSTSPDLADWPAAVRVIDKQPLWQLLPDLLSSQKDLWRSRNERGSLLNLIIYHNGLTDLVHPDLLSSLQRSIRKKIKAAKMTLIAVNKDHHTKSHASPHDNKAKTDKAMLNGAIIRRSRDGERV